MLFTSIKQKIYTLLRYSERWTHTDMVYLAKGGFWLTMSKIIGMFSGFILAIIYANFLAKEDYATYKYILSIAALFGISTLTGLNTALTRAIALGNEGSFWPTIKMRLRWGISSIIAGIIIAGYYFYKQNEILGILFLIAAIFAPLIESMMHGAYLQGKKLFKTSAVINSITSVCITLTLGLILLFSPSVIIFVFSYFLITFFVNLIFFIYTIKKFKFNKKEDPEVNSFGKHLSLMDILGTISLHIDKVLMWQFLGPAQLAIYSFATIPVEQIRTFLKSILPLALPKLAVQKADILKKTLAKKVIIFMFLLLIPIILYIIFSPLIFKLFFPEYVEAVRYSQLFSLVIIFFPLNLFSSFFQAHAQKKPLYLMNTISPLIKISLFGVLIPMFAIDGAIWAILISSVLNAFLVFYLFNKTANHQA